MNDLTIIYYTANSNKKKFMKNTQKYLLKAAGSTPIIAVSFKPTIIGNNCRNICIGKQKRSNYMIYLQVLIGTREARTKYIAMAEDDMLYHPSHFTYRPADDKTFSYNTNKWSIFSWINPPFFSYRITKLMNSLITTKKALIKTLEERHAIYSSLKEMPHDVYKYYWSEPGRFENNIGITPLKSEEYRSKHPNVMFSTPEALGFQKLGIKKAHSKTRADKIDYWGSAEKVLKYYT